jgi:hypothetical protein
MFNDAQHVVRDWQLNIDVDMVLRGQGADSGVLRQRKPCLIEIAERATLEWRTTIPASGSRTVDHADRVIDRPGAGVAGLDAIA